MGYTHYLEIDSPLTEEQAEKCARACLDFLQKMPPSMLAELLESPEALLDDGMNALAAANRAVLSGNWAAAQNRIARAWSGGFAVQPKNTETFGFNAGDQFMFCKTGGPSNPADPLVVCLHMACQEALRDGEDRPLRFRSDGMKPDMAKGMMLWMKCTGRKIPDLPFVLPDPDAGLQEAPAAPKPALREDAVLEAAQCIWEAVLPQIDGDGAFRNFMLDEGIAELRGRMRSPELLDACLEGWDDICPPDGRSFDLEYVPQFVDACVDPETAELRQGWKECLKQAIGDDDAPKP